MDRIDTSYPLHWPEGWKRSSSVRRAAFDRNRTLAQARSFLLDEVNRLGGRERSVIISSNVRVRPDGLPYSGQAQPQNRGVAVYFVLDERDQVLACDRWDRVEDNLYAIAKHIEAVRAQARYGVGTVEQAFRGYTPLPAVLRWYEVLGVSPAAGTKEIDEAFNRLVLAGHSDRGGAADIGLLKAARDEGRRARGV